MQVQVQVVLAAVQRSARAGDLRPVSHSGLGRFRRRAAILWCFLFFYMW